MSHTQPCDREGDYRGQITDYMLREEKSGAICLVLNIDLVQLWDRDVEQWVDWSQYQIEVIGNIYLVLKNGSPNENQVKSLCRCAGWDGDLTCIAQKTWKPCPCQFTVKANVYKGVTTYRAEWLNTHDNVPGVGTVCDMLKVSELQSRLGGSFRAIAGNAKRAASVPNGVPPQPPAPPPLARAMQPQPQPEMANSIPARDPNAGGEDIPF